MKEPGQVAVLRFPTTGLAMGKPRPVLLLAPLPGRHDDWLVSMISMQVQQAVDGFDEVIGPSDVDFEATGLRMKSIIRIARLAVVSSDLLVGAIGCIGEARLQRIRTNLTRWIQGLSNP